MGSCADQIKVVTVDFVEQEPIGFDVAITMMFPVAAERVVLVTGRQGGSFNQEKNQHTQLGHVFSTPLGQFDIAPEFRAAYRDAHVQIPNSSKSAPAVLKRFPLP